MKHLYADDLAVAQEGSYYTIVGTGEPLEEWTANYEKFLAEAQIGKPKEWFKTTGESVNAYAATVHRGVIRDTDKFKPDLTLLLFPLTDLHVGRLAAFKLQVEDRWFDDVIRNMRVTDG